MKSVDASSIRKDSQVKKQTVRIPIPSPDLDCSDIAYTNFTMLPPDPHGFDVNEYGIGCEK